MISPMKIVNTVNLLDHIHTWVSWGVSLKFIVNLYMHPIDAIL